ncbi:MAG: deoxyuridine 5'-triphosphate nucleotidohydrolase [Bacilli bacterium]
MRGFEKISFEEFKKSFGDDKKLYEEYLLPKRASKNSAGYDLLAIKDYIIKPKEILKIPTGLKVRMHYDEVLLIVVRSSMGFKYNVRLTNQVGVIDSDFYNNIDNEGHFFVSLQNEGDKDFVIKKGEAFAQGIFIKYLISDDDTASEIRKGGLGSTNKRKDDENE